VAALSVWVLTVIASSILGFLFEGLPGWVLRGLAGALGAALIALAAKALAAHLGWYQAGAIGVIAGASIACNRWLLSIASGGAAVSPGEGLRWALLQGLGAYLLHPYVRCAFVGLGDAYHYAISMADFIRQVRAGVFPVFIGQTEFAFNGGIHTVRTAPYFLHLGALLDMLTLNTLPFYAVANLAIVASALAGVLGTYAALLLYAPGRSWTAFALAALYILSPAVLAPLCEGDMIATFMTVPLTPWWVLGLALAADDPAALRPWVIQGAALAALWWAHPPIAAWASALSLATWVAIAAGHEGRRGVVLERAALAACLCAALAAYEFASVLTLRLPPGPDTQSFEAATVFGVVANNWKAPLLPLSENGRNLLGDIQLGYALLLAAPAALLAIRHRRSAAILLGCMAALLVLILPVPGVTARLWALVPHAVIDTTNIWPMQRFYPILAALAVFAALCGLARLDLRAERVAAVTAFALAAGLFWSLTEAQVLLINPEATARQPESSADMFRPENLKLTRVSYMFFGFYPDYFSHSVMEPFLETRLLDLRSLEVLADGSASISGSRAPGSHDVELRQIGNGELGPEIRVNGRQTVVLRFDFLGREPAGTLAVNGRTLSREYSLPFSGGVKSFGSGPTCSRVIAIRNKDDSADSVRLTYIPGSADDAAYYRSRAFARLTVEPFGKGGHVIELHSLLPFHATVQADRPELLETPRVDVPGYRATVNGRSAAITRTPDGLVGVKVPAGTNDVVVDYPGSAALRLAFGTSLGAWLALALCSAGLPLADRSGERRRRMLAPLATAYRAARPQILLAALASAVALGGLWTWRWLAEPHIDTVHLELMLPAGRANHSEPLVTTGRTGAGDVIFVSYLGGGWVSIGHDWWGHPLALSKPFAVDFLVPQRVQISMNSLTGRRRWPWAKPDTAPKGILVRWNGREVLWDKRGPYPPGPSGAEFGVNSIGASSCGPEFTGEILVSDSIGSLGH
jgi:hypothetical protein